MHKIIKISTNLFDLNIKWNGAVVSIESAILIGTFFLKLFSDSPSVDRLSVVILLFNVLAIVASMLIGMKVTVENVDSTVKGTMETTVEKRAVVKEKETTRKSSGPKEIRNKVPIPTQSKASTPPRGEPTPAVTYEEPPTGATTSEEPAVKTLDQMTEQDWEALFKMD